MIHSDHTLSNRFRILFSRFADLFNRETVDLSSLALATTTAVIVTDARGKIAHVSPGYSTLTGFTPVEIIGQTPAMALHGQHTDHRTVETLRARCQAAEPFSVNILLYAKNHRPVWVASQGRPVIRGGRLHGYVITQSAITPKTAPRPVDLARANAA